MNNKNFCKTIILLFCFILSLIPASLFADALSYLNGDADYLEGNTDAELLEGTTDAEYLEGNADLNYLEGTVELEYLDGNYIAEQFLDADYIVEQYIDEIYMFKVLDGNREDLILDIDGNGIPIGKILRDIGIAEGVMFIAAIACSAIPGAQPFTAIIIGLHVKALGGAAISAAISGVTTFVSSNGDIEKTFGKVLEGAADGYKWAAIFASGAQAVNSAKLINENIKVAKTIASRSAEAMTAVQQQAVNKFGKEAYRFAMKYGDDAFDVLANSGDDLVNCWIKAPLNRRDAVYRLFKDFPDIAPTMIQANGTLPSYITSKFLDEASSNRLLNEAIRNGKAYGYTAEQIFKKGITYNQIILKSNIYNLAKTTRSLPRIQLTISEMSLINQNPRTLREIIPLYTGGKDLRNGYLEFFSRLPKDQAIKLWDNNAVRDIIKNYGIRAGGVHEWLMCEHFISFLTDSKWGSDGDFLANLLPKLTQSTESVIMKNGWGHLDELFGNGPIHRGIEKIIQESSSAEEVIDKLDSFIKNNFTRETYDTFRETLESSLVSA